MLLHHVGRWLCILGIAGSSAGAVVSCGGGSNSQFQGGAPDASTGEDASARTDGGSLVNNDGGIGNGCKPKTCAQLGYTCGPNSDGCGNDTPVRDLHGPPVLRRRRLQQVRRQQRPASRRRRASARPTTCAPLGYNCGLAGDGCGGVAQLRQRARSPSSAAAAASTSAAATTACCPTAAPLHADHLRGARLHLRPRGRRLRRRRSTAARAARPSTAAAAASTQCGGNNGLPPDGGVALHAARPARARLHLRPAGDGCGGVARLRRRARRPSTAAAAASTSAAATTASRPTAATRARPTTCAALGYNCGQAGDGCGGLLNCGTCTARSTAAAAASTCAAATTALGPDGGVDVHADDVRGPRLQLRHRGRRLRRPAQLRHLHRPAVLRRRRLRRLRRQQRPPARRRRRLHARRRARSSATTAAPPATAAAAMLNCGTCTSPQYCGGGGYDVCGPAVDRERATAARRRLTGYVYDPANNLPVYNALVYVPVGAVVTPTTGVNPAPAAAAPRRPRTPRRTPASTASSR